MSGILENYIPFVNGGGFGVTGEICPATLISGSSNEELRRTEFVFKTAKLDLGDWGVYNFPPVGEGWFDTIYLDEGRMIVVFVLPPTGNIINMSPTSPPSSLVTII